MNHNRNRVQVSRRTFLAGTASAGAAFALGRVAIAEPERPKAGLIPLGVAKVDVTPDRPVLRPLWKIGSSLRSKLSCPTLSNEEPSETTNGAICEPARHLGAVAPVERFADHLADL